MQKSGIYSNAPASMMEQPLAYQPHGYGASYGSPYQATSSYQGLSGGGFAQYQPTSTKGFGFPVGYGQPSPVALGSQLPQQQFGTGGYQSPLPSSYAGGYSPQYLPTSYPQQQSYQQWSAPKKPSKMHGGYQMMSGALQGGFGKVFKQPQMMAGGYAKEGYGIQEYTATTQPAKVGGQQQLYYIPQQQVASPVIGQYQPVSQFGQQQPYQATAQPWQTPALSPQQQSSWTRPAYQQFQPTSAGIGEQSGAEYSRYGPTSGGVQEQQQPVHYERTGWEPIQQPGQSAVAEQSTSKQPYQMTSQGGQWQLQPQQEQQGFEALGGGEQLQEQEPHEEEVIMERVTMHTVM